MIRKSGTRFSEEIMLKQSDLKRSRQVANRPASAMDAGGADLDKT
jgi:hypothetical protein